MDVDCVFEFYRTEFVPVHSDLVGCIGDKPQQCRQSQHPQPS